MRQRTHLTQSRIVAGRFRSDVSEILRLRFACDRMLTVVEVVLDSPLLLSSATDRWSSASTSNRVGTLEERGDGGTRWWIVPLPLDASSPWELIRRNRAVGGGGAVGDVTTRLLRRIITLDTD
jgi:hypothetical protein